VKHETILVRFAPSILTKNVTQLRPVVWDETLEKSAPTTGVFGRCSTRSRSRDEHPLSRPQNPGVFDLDVPEIVKQKVGGFGISCWRYCL